MPGPNARLRRHLAAQHNVVRPKQAMDDGHTEDEFYGMVRGGWLERVHYGVYVGAGSRPTPERAAVAAAMRCWPESSISGRFVLGLFGIEGFTRFDPFVILVPPSRRISNVTFPVVTDRSFGDDRAVMDGMPIVTMLRGLIDASTDLNDREVLTAIDSGKWRNFVSDRSLADVLERCAWHPQARRIRRLVDDGLTKQESHGERHLARLLDGYAPQPDYQVWLTPSIRVDAVWRDAWMVMEYLGREHHAAPWRRERDAERDAAIRGHGYHVEYVTKDDLAHPEATRARLIAVRETLLVRRSLA